MKWTTSCLVFSPSARSVLWSWGKLFSQRASAKIPKNKVIQHESVCLGGRGGDWNETITRKRGMKHRLHPPICHVTRNKERNQTFHQEIAAPMLMMCEISWWRDLLLPQPLHPLTATRDLDTHSRHSHWGGGGARLLKPVVHELGGDDDVTVLLNTQQTPHQ